MKAPSTLRCLLIGSWARLVRLPHRRVTKGIVPPQYIYPTTGYNLWLVDDIKWILRDEKAYMKTSKKAKRTKWSPWYAPCFTFLHFYDSHVFVFEFNKGLKCSKSPIKTILSSFNLSNKRVTFLLSMLIVISFFFSFSFSFLFPLPCNFRQWRPFGNFRHSHGLFP